MGAGFFCNNEGFGVYGFSRALQLGFLTGFRVLGVLGLGELYGRPKEFLRCVQRRRIHDHLHYPAFGESDSCMSVLSEGLSTPVVERAWRVHRSARRSPEELT